MASQKTKVPAADAAAQGIEPTQYKTVVDAGSEVPVYPAAQDFGDYVDDDEYNSDDSDYSPPPSMTSSMIERGQGNQNKVGDRYAYKGDLDQSKKTSGGQGSSTGGTKGSATQGSNTKDSGKGPLVRVKKPEK